jgi:hypothetical protein
MTAETASQLLQASDDGKIDEVRSLLKGGANPNAQNDLGFRPLHIAASAGHLDIIQSLIESGAEVDAKNYYGATALFCAAFAGNANVVPLLLSKGAEVDVPNKDDITPLMAAAGKGHYEVVELLLAAGAKVNKQSAYGATALMKAARDGHADVVRILINKGADVGAVDETGATALEWAKKYNAASVVSILQEMVAKANNPEAQLRDVIREALQTDVVPKTAEEVAAKLANELVARLGNDEVAKIDPARVADCALAELRRYMNMPPDRWPQNGLLQIVKDVSDEFSPHRSGSPAGQQSTASKKTPANNALTIIILLASAVCLAGIWWSPLGYLNFWLKILLSVVAFYVVMIGAVSIFTLVDSIAKRFAKK